MLIITMLGYPVASLPILTIIATIIDMPATVLNVVGDDVSSMLVTRIVDGKKGFRDVPQNPFIAGLGDTPKIKNL